MLLSLLEEARHSWPRSELSSAFQGEIEGTRPRRSKNARWRSGSSSPWGEGASAPLMWLSSRSSEPKISRQLRLLGIHSMPSLMRPRIAWSSAC